jgi:hypothetical protein
MKTQQEKLTVPENSEQTGISSNGTPVEIVNHNQKAEIVAIEPSANVTPNDLLRIAVEANADVEKIGKLMELQIRWEQQKAQKTYVAAMARFRTCCPSIFKTKNGHNSKYAPLSEIVDGIKDAEMQCGLDHTWRTEQSDKDIKVSCRVTHLDGHYEETSLIAAPDGSGSKNAIQAIGSTVSYLQRYTLCALLGIATQDMDNDGNGNGGPKEPASQQRLIDMLIDDACKRFTAKKRTLLSADSEIDLNKFKEQLRVNFSALPDEQKRKFEWNKDGIESLAEKIDVNKVAVRKR